MEFPKKYQNEDGVILEARDEVQAAAFEQGGFFPVGEEPKKRKPKE